MKYRVKITAQALRDVETQLRWFQEQQALPAAGRWYSQLMSRIETLEEQPGRCRLAAEADDLKF